MVMMRLADYLAWFTIIRMTLITLFQITHLKHLILSYYCHVIHFFTIIFGYPNNSPYTCNRQYGNSAKQTF